MSKVRNLTEITTLESNDLLYAVDLSAGSNGGRKVSVANLGVSLGVSTLEKKFLQYYNASLQTNATTTFTDVSLSTNASSLPGTRFTKASATQFRCDFNGYVKVHFKALAYTGTNDRSAVFRLAKNGSGQNFTKVYCYGKSQIERGSSGSGGFIFNCAVNDYFTLQFAAVEGGVTATLPVEGASLYIETLVVS